MTKVIYLISRGEYSDYEVYAVFSDEETAKAKVLELNQSYWDAMNFAGNDERRPDYSEETYPYFVEEKPFNTMNVGELHYRVGVYGNNGEVYTAHVINPLNVYPSDLADANSFIKRSGADEYKRYIKFYGVGPSLEVASRRAWERRNRYVAVHPDARLVFNPKETGPANKEIQRIEAFFKECIL